MSLYYECGNWENNALYTNKSEWADKISPHHTHNVVNITLLNICRPFVWSVSNSQFKNYLCFPFGCYPTQPSNFNTLIWNTTYAKVLYTPWIMISRVIHFYNFTNNLNYLQHLSKHCILVFTVIEFKTKILMLAQKNLDFRIISMKFYAHGRHFKIPILQKNLFYIELELVKQFIYSCSHYIDRNEFLQKRCLFYIHIWTIVTIINN